MSTPTFESHGKVWIRHKPGDPCPVSSNIDLHVIQREEADGKYRESMRAAHQWEWGNLHVSRFEIIGWRYANPEDATAPKDEGVSAEEFTLQRFEKLLTKHGLVNEAAFEDSGDYDAGVISAAVARVFQEIKSAMESESK